MDENTGAVPEFGVRRLLVVVSGSLSAAHMPFWLNWLEASYPDIEVRTVLTRSATRFVSRDALSVSSRRKTEIDAWPEGHLSDSPHVELSLWPDAVIVYPATFHFLARYALALGDTPVQLALQCTTALVGLAPALPPGGTRSPGYRRHAATLRTLPNVVLADPVPGRSAHTGRDDGHVPVHLPVLIERLEERRRLLSEAEDHVART